MTGSGEARTACLYSQQIERYVLTGYRPRSLVDGTKVSEEPAAQYPVHPTQLLNTTVTQSGSSGVKVAQLYQD